MRCCWWLSLVMQVGLLFSLSHSFSPSSPLRRSPWACFVARHGHAYRQGRLRPARNAGEDGRQGARRYIVVFAHGSRHAIASYCLDGGDELRHRVPQVFKFRPPKRAIHGHQICPHDTPTEHGTPVAPARETAATGSAPSTRSRLVRLGLCRPRAASGGRAHVHLIETVRGLRGSRGHGYRDL